MSMLALLVCVRAKERKVNTRATNGTPHGPRERERERRAFVVLLFESSPATEFDLNVLEMDQLAESNVAHDKHQFRERRDGRCGCLAQRLRHVLDDGAAHLVGLLRKRVDGVDSLLGSREPTAQALGRLLHDACELLE